MSLELVVIVAVVAVVGLVALAIGFRAVSARRASDGESFGPPGPLEGIADVIDRSIGMYLVRRLMRRPTGPPPEAEAARVISQPPRADGTEGQGARVIVAKVETYESPAEPAGVIGRETLHDPTSASATTSVDRRERLIRDSGYALLALAAVALVVSVLIPGGLGQPPSGGGVAGETNVPPSPAQTDSPASEPAAASVAPSLRSAPGGAATATLRPLPTPAPTQRLSPRPTLPGSTPTPAPSSTPTPTSTSTSTPLPTPIVSATPIPSSTPSSIPTPTPSPTPTPTAAPTPTPTAAPTPTPVPSP